MFQPLTVSTKINLSEPTFLMKTVPSKMWVILVSTVFVAILFQPSVQSLQSVQASKIVIKF